MTTVGRRGSRDFGWNWSRPPAGPRRPPPLPPLLPLAGAALLFVAIATAFLAIWLSDSANSSLPPTVTPTATATVAPTANPTPTPLPTPSPPPSRTPSPTVTPTSGPEFSLAVWDGRSWRSESNDLPPKTFREGEAVPFMLRIDGARPRVSYATIRYTCRTVQFLSGFDRDSGSSPALAAGGPPSGLPDSTVALPDDPTTGADDGESGALSLWGGSFGPVELVAGTPPSACERSLSVKLMAAQDTLFLMWGAIIAPGAAGGDVPVRITVLTPARERRIEIDPASIVPAP